MYHFIKIIIIAAFLVAITVTDIKERKIKNKTVMPVLVIGLTLGILNRSLPDCCLGMLLPLVLFPLYACKMLGAGDVKALCAIGAVVGLRLSAITMVCTFLSGGVIAAGIMLLRANIRTRIQYFWAYLQLCWVTKRIQKYEFGGDGAGTFRFSYAITVGTVLMLLYRYVPAT